MPRRASINPWLAESWEHGPQTAGHGASSCTRACNSTTATASSPPRTWCTPMPCGVTRTTLAVKTHRSSGYRAGICAGPERIEVVNDHEIVMHCKVVCLDMPFYYSSASERHDLQQGAVGQRRGDGVRDASRRAPGRTSSRSEQLSRYCPVRACPNTALEAWRGGLERDSR